MAKSFSQVEKLILSLCKTGQLDRAITVLEASKRSINPHTYIQFLKLCAQKKALDVGTKIHSHISAAESCDCKSNRVLNNTLITMYAKCGRVEMARRVFDEMKERDVCSWTVLIAAYARHGRPEEAIELFNKMQDSRIRPNDLTFSAIIPACAALGYLELGAEIHRQVRNLRFSDRVSVMTALVDMYAKCGSIKDARQVFDEMSRRNIVSWTAIIGAYAKQGPRSAEEALKLFDKMQREGVRPDEFTFAAVLPACAALRDLERGMDIHDQITRGGCQMNAILATRLMDMYVQCGSLDRAKELFDRVSERDVVLFNAMITGYARSGLINKALELFEKMPHRHTDSWNSMISGLMHHGDIDHALTLFQEIPRKNLVSWNTIIAGMAQNGYIADAIEMFRKMLSLGFIANSRTFSSILRICDVESGMQIHEKIILSKPNLDVTIENALIDMYVRCGSLNTARILFDKMRQRNVASWNMMIAGYSRHGFPCEALELYDHMKREGFVPTQYTYTSVLSACAELASLNHGIEIHHEITRCGYLSNVIISTALIDMYIQCGKLDKARHLFDSMDNRDVVSWNAMISGYMQKGLFERALDLFNTMPQQNSVSWIIMISGFCQKGFVGMALEYFQKMPTKTIKIWNAVIIGLVQHEYNREALDIFRQMLDSCVCADVDTFTSILSACASLPSTKQGIEIHGNVIRGGLVSDLQLTNALISFYSKCGSIETAWILFHKLQRKDIISWNTMIAGYAIHGHGKVAVELFEQMKETGVSPSPVTLVSVLSACTHAGLVEKGCDIFNTMSERYGITPSLQHYKCFVDLLGRAGRFDEVEHVINSMPMEPDSALWASLLGACRIHNNIDLAEQVAQNIFQMNCTYAGPYITLSNMYAAAQRWADFKKVRKLMNERGIRKTPAYSWIEVNSKVHIFGQGNIMLNSVSFHPSNDDCFSNMDDDLECPADEPFSEYYQLADEG